MGVLRLALALSLVVGCAEEEASSAPRLRGPTCPDRMAHLPSVGACIDRHEAVVEGDGASARAEPADGRVPTMEITWAEAQRACRNAGYRLCARDEWMQACAGTTDPEGGREYPYGDEFEPERCNSAEDGTNVAERRVAPGGSFERCVTPEGVYDLSGNAGEWLATADPSGSLRELRGGSYANYQRAAKCVTTPLAFQPPEPGWDGLGFRCCVDAR